MTELNGPIICQTMEYANYTVILCNEDHPTLVLYDQMFIDYQHKHISNMPGCTSDYILLKCMRDPNTKKYKFILTIVSHLDNFNTAFVDNCIQTILDTIFNEDICELICCRGYDYEVGDDGLDPRIPIIQECLDQLSIKFEARKNGKDRPIIIHMYQKRF